MGVSPRYLSTLQSNAIVPKNIPGISSSLRLVTSTGMVLPTSLFQYFYSPSGFPSHVHLANISGGTDLAGAFGDSIPLLPVHDTGGCQGRSLGIDVRVYDSTIEATKEGEIPIGREVPEGEPGDLVAVQVNPTPLIPSPTSSPNLLNPHQPFPNIPIKFFSDAPIHRLSKYYSSYFTRFLHVWTHGDFIQIDPLTRVIIFLGRADGVLNPSGVRFGSAEIYAIIEEKFGDVVEDSICVGQRRKGDSDESVMLFLKMREGKRFTGRLLESVRREVEKGLSRRHVPRYVFETFEIPVSDRSLRFCYCFWTVVLICVDYCES
jgi:acetoacetyl-CoA synthetase